MLGISSFPRAYADKCRERMERQPSTLKALKTAAGKNDSAALKAFLGEYR